MFIGKVMGVTVDDAYMDEKGRFALERCGLIAYSHGEYYALGRKLGKFGYSVKKPSGSAKKKTAAGTVNGTVKKKAPTGKGRIKHE